MHSSSYYHDTQGEVILISSKNVPPTICRWVPRSRRRCTRWPPGENILESFSLPARYKQHQSSDLVKSCAKLTTNLKLFSIACYCSQLSQLSQWTALQVDGSCFKVVFYKPIKSFQYLKPFSPNVNTNGTWQGLTPWNISYVYFTMSCSLGLHILEVGGSKVIWPCFP